jgi:glutathione S-transferase
MRGALGLLEVACRERGPAAWLVDNRLTQADITVACISTFLKESLDVFGGDAPYAALQAHVVRCEALPEFRATHAPWFSAEMKS